MRRLLPVNDHLLVTAGKTPMASVGIYSHLADVHFRKDGSCNYMHPTARQTPG